MAKHPLLVIPLIALVAISFAACSRDLIPPSNLLLSAADFPEMDVTKIVQKTGADDEGGPAVQVKLRANGFIILESLVLFDDRGLALDILRGIKQDQTAQGVDPVPVEGFYDNSGVLVEHLNDDEKSTVFFVEGRALVRITVSGNEASANIWEIAGRARDKI